MIILRISKSMNTSAVEIYCQNIGRKVSPLAIAKWDGVASSFPCRRLHKLVSTCLATDVQGIRKSKQVRLEQVTLNRVDACFDHHASYFVVLVTINDKSMQ